MQIGALSVSLAPMFVLNEPLAADTVELERRPLCLALLMNDSRYPWLILVPRRSGLRELHDLTPTEQSTLMEEISRASRALEKAFAPAKINVAALGNVVEQLHVHVVARFRNDAAWPGPVWGKLPPKPYGAEDMAEISARIKSALNAGSRKK